jgi:hypothetical protein
MRAASFKSLYQKRPAEDTRRALGCVSGRSRYSTKTCRTYPTMGSFNKLNVRESYSSSRMLAASH